MVAQVVGIRKDIDFMADDGRQIKGTKLFVLYQDDKVDGVAAKGIFCRSELDVSHVEVGRNYNFRFESNFSGRARLMEVVPIE